MQQSETVRAPLGARAMPDTLVILFFVALLAAALTYLVPPGTFATETVVTDTPSGTVERQLILPDTFAQTEGERGFRWFADGGEVGLANVPFAGMVSGDQWGAAVGVMAFIILVGGAFGIIMQTRSIEYGIMALINRAQGYDLAFLGLLFVLFSFGGAIFGMGEEAIAFCLVLLPVLRNLGYDAITTVFVTYVATQIGFATSWMNPFSVAIAQGIAEVPLLSGAGVRFAIWLLFTLVGLAWLLSYARTIRQPASSSAGTANDAAGGAGIGHHAVAHTAMGSERDGSPFGWLDGVILLTFLAGLVWVIWGVVARGYYIPEIATQFVALGIVIGLLAILGRRLTANGMASAFKQGAQQLLPAALIVGFAKGIILLLGGDDPTTPSTLNTMLHGAGQLLGGVPEWVAGGLMVFVQGGFNFFVTSGSGQAALTMPLMAPLADLTGVSRQVAVLAFQLGDGLTNMIVPTSAALIGCLGAVGLDWGTWFKFIWRFQLVVAALALLVVTLAVLMGFH